MNFSIKGVFHITLKNSFPKSLNLLVDDGYNNAVNCPMHTGFLEIDKISALIVFRGQINGMNRPSSFANGKQERIQSSEHIHLILQMPEATAQKFKIIILDGRNKNVSFPP